MGDGSADGPAMRRSMETRGCAALDRDPTVTVVSIAAETIAMKSNPVTAKRIVRPLLHHALASDRVNPDRSVNFLQHLEAAGGGFPSGHANGNREGKAEVAVLQQQQPALFPQHHNVTFKALAQLSWY